MWNKKYVLFLSLVALVYFISCTQKKKVDFFEEGIIIYEVTYFESDDENPLISLLPNTIELKFKKNKSATKIVGWLGIFSSIYISDIENGLNYTLLKMMNKKFIYKSTIDEPIPGYKKSEKCEVNFTNKRKKILGYKCNLAMVSNSNYKTDPLPVYYSKDIDLDVYFLNNLFMKKIPGFLFEFPIEMNGVPMSLRVKEIIPCEISDSEFYVPDDFQSVSKEKMQEIIESII